MTTRLAAAAGATATRQSPATATSRTVIRRGISTSSSWYGSAPRHAWLTASTVSDVSTREQPHWSRRQEIAPSGGDQHHCDDGAVDDHRAPQRLLRQAAAVAGADLRAEDRARGDQQSRVPGDVGDDDEEEAGDEVGEPRQDV